MSRLEAENKQLRNEVAELAERIDLMHIDMQKLKDSHARELNRTNEQHWQEVNNLKRIIEKAYGCGLSEQWNTVFFVRHFFGIKAFMSVNTSSIE